jgi:hypothetical protein
MERWSLQFLLGCLYFYELPDDCRMLGWEETQSSLETGIAWDKPRSSSCGLRCGLFKQRVGRAKSSLDDSCPLCQSNEIGAMSSQNRSLIRWPVKTPCYQSIILCPSTAVRCLVDTFEHLVAQRSRRLHVDGESKALLVFQR